jgi:Ras-related protein Rab-28
VVFVYDITN